MGSHYDQWEEEDLSERQQWENQMEMADRNYRESLKEDEEIAYQKELEEWESLSDEALEEAKERQQELEDLFYGVEYDNVNWPKHYNSYPGVEVIDLTQHMNFCRGNVVKYVARAEFKGQELEDLKKAKWYLEREINRLESSKKEEETKSNPLPPSPWVYAGETND